MNLNICNNCGGEFTYRGGKYICLACGSPKPEAITSEEVTLLYTAYQKLRLADFAEAELEFDDILRKYPKNPNAYWGRLMARFGIKYERDFDGRMIPTCYAASIESFLSAQDYQMALKYADTDSKAYFKQQAEYIERVRKEWIDKAKKEKPYDIFICYKDSDLANGIERTKDSYAAQELYLHLMRKGYRVFYSRESLIDKVGEKYEPYIFQALSTAKVMIVYGSNPEYINSTWLKNEWTRYAKRIKAGEKKQGSLLVACDGFQPSALPTVLSSMQCLNASQKSFYSNLDDAIAMILHGEKKSSIGNALGSKTDRTKSKALPIMSAVLLLAVIGCTVWFFVSGNNTVDDSCVHEIKIEAAVDPTCTEDGYTEGRSCTLCGEELLARQRILALGHTPDGKLDCEKDQSCRTCGTILSSAGDHTFVKNLCSVCGKKEAVSEGFTYKVNADKETCTITGIGSCTDTALVIPCEIDGYTVTNIAEMSLAYADFVSVRIAETVTAVGYGAFMGCDSLTSVEIPDNVTQLDGYVFMDCQNLKDVKLGKGITRIPECLLNSKKMTSIVISAEVINIDSGAFCYCENLAEIRYEGSTAQWTDGTMERGEAWDDGTESYTVYCTDGIVTRDGEIRLFSEGLLFDSDGHGTSSVTDKGVWKGTDLVLPPKHNGEAVKIIGLSAFEGTDLTSVILGIGIGEIEEAAFRGCDDLVRAVMTSGLTHIGYGAFFYCGKLTETVIPESVVFIDGEAFRGCESLRVIRYGGTKAQWETIEFGDHWDDETGNYTVYCTDGTIVKSSDEGFVVTPGEIPPSIGPGEYQE